MNSTRTVDGLNRLLAIHYRSLPMYLSNTTPWTRRGDEKAAETLSRIAADQKGMVDRFSQMVLDADAAPDLGSGRDFTIMNDLSLSYLLTRVIEHQQQDIVAIQQCVAGLGNDAPEAKSLAEAALGMAKRHLESLEKTVKETAGWKKSAGSTLDT